MRKFEARVEEELGMRADVFLSTVAKAMTRSQLRSRGVSIEVNGVAAKPSRLLRAGDLVSIRWEDDGGPSLEPEDIPLSVVFENDQVLVVDKPQGMVSHPANGNWTGTLVNAFLWHLGARPGATKLFDGCQPGGAGMRPGIVHRLDKDTSGVIILAKSAEVHAFLASQFASRKTRKRYIAIVKGSPPLDSGEMDTRIARDPSDRKRFAVAEGGRGKRAVTRYTTLRRYGKDYAFLLLEPRTGRTHQLRVHMKALGCPILGDPIYGRKDARFPEATLMLHAYRLGIALPGETERRLFTAAMPERFKAVFRTLEAKKSGP